MIKKTINIPNTYKYSFAEKEIISLYNKGKYDTAILKIKSLKKTKHDRLIRLINLHCFIKCHLYQKAIDLAKLFYPYIRKDDIDLDTLLILNELYGLIGYPNIAQGYLNNYYFLTNEQNVIFNDTCAEPLTECNFESVSGSLIAHNQLLELALLYLFCKKNSLAISNELQFFYLNNFLFSLSVSKIEKLIKKTKNVIVIHSDSSQELLIDLLKKNGLLVNIQKLDSGFCENMHTDSLNILIGKTETFLEIMEDNAAACKNIEVYCENLEDCSLHNCSVYLCGDYFSMMHFKYDFDFRQWQNESCECDFSIVIPVRNDGKYLEFAIQSCLHQTYKGSYEVLISDNSDADNKDAYNCYRKFDDPKLKYIKTPKVLPLSKSFEFAYFNCKGKYILSIGSDDSVLNYALDVLNSILIKNPFEVISWGNARYQWPSHNNCDNANLMIRKAGFIQTIFDSDDLLKQYYSNKLDFGYMPKLYLGTCFHRNLIKKYIETTGKFEDGYTQDIYTGVKTAMLVRKICRIGFPLTVSGVSKNSSGLGFVGTLTNSKALFNKLKNIALTYEDNTYYCKKQREIIDNMCYVRTFSLMEYSEIQKANRFQLNDVYVNPFIDSNLIINVDVCCDIDFIVSGFLKYDIFYNGDIKKQLNFVRGISLANKVSKFFPGLYFWYVNNIKKYSDGYRINYFYGRKKNIDNIMKGNGLIEDYFSKEVKLLIDGK